MGKESFVKRKSRSQVLLDIDDLYILKFLSTDENKNKISGLTLDKLKENMNMSHNALLVHLNRLETLNLIFRVRPKNDYKTKLVNITKNGINIKNEISEALSMKEKGQTKIIATKKDWLNRDKEEEITIGWIPNKKDTSHSNPSLDKGKRTKL